MRVGDPGDGVGVGVGGRVDGVIYTAVLIGVAELL
jgi:hypothetical protein